MQALPNIFQGLDRDRGKRRGRIREIRFALLQNRRNIVDARQNLLAARGIIRPRHSERFDHRCERLRNVEGGIAFPARIDVQFPAHPRQSGADQFVIDLFRNRPTLDIDLLPACFELSKISTLLVDGSCRPIAYSIQALDSVYVIARERRGLRPLGPKIVSEFVKRFALREHCLR